MRSFFMIFWWWSWWLTHLKIHLAEVLNKCKVQNMHLYISTKLLIYSNVEILKVFCCFSSLFCGLMYYYNTFICANSHWHFGLKCACTLVFDGFKMKYRIVIISPGSFSDEDIHGCEQQPCQNGGVCESYNGGFRCLCSQQSQNGRLYGGAHFLMTWQRTLPEGKHFPSLPAPSCAKHTRSQIKWHFL